MPSISTNTLSEHDVLRLILDCKKSGKSLDKYLHISNLKKNNIIDLPQNAQRSLDTYASTGTLEVIVISR